MTSAAVSASSQMTAKHSSRNARSRRDRDSPTMPNAMASSGNSSTSPTAITMRSGASTIRRTSLDGTMGSSAKSPITRRQLPARALRYRADAAYAREMLTSTLVVSR
jgi:hypothetical protein